MGSLSPPLQVSQCDCNWGQATLHRSHPSKGHDRFYQGGEFSWTSARGPTLFFWGSLGEPSISTRVTLRSHASVGADYCTHQVRTSKWHPPYVSIHCKRSFATFISLGRKGILFGFAKVNQFTAYPRGQSAALCVLHIGHSFTTSLAILSDYTSFDVPSEYAWDVVQVGNSTSWELRLWQLTLHVAVAG